MKKLISGIRQFQEHVFPGKRALFERLSEGQHPEVLLITCSDSRIDPHLLTQAAPGELFIVRNAGNVVPAHGVAGAEAATIEFAVTALGVSHIVVCGHSQCGAMTALVDPSQAARLPNVARWLEHARAAAEIVAQGAENAALPQRVDQAIRANVLVQLQNLKTHPVVAAALRAGRLQLHGWIYRFETGEVLAHDPQRDAFVPIQERYPDGWAFAG